MNFRKIDPEKGMFLEVKGKITKMGTTGITTFITLQTDNNKTYEMKIADPLIDFKQFQKLVEIQEKVKEQKHFRIKARKKEINNHYFYETELKNIETIKEPVK